MSREAMKRIKTWSERCEEHPDHQQGMISEGMIRARMQEEIDELRQALEAEQEPSQPPEWVGLTNKDIDDCYFAARQPDFDIWAFAAEIEEVLKQKNAWGNHLV